MTIRRAAFLLRFGKPSLGGRGTNILVEAMTRLSRKTLLMLLVGASALGTANALAADNFVLKRFTSGSGQDAVGIVEAGEDTELSGPQALYAGDNGELFILDQVNGRVLRFEAKRPAAQTRSLELPEDVQPTDLVVMKGDILVWDGDVRALRPTGREDAPVRGLEEFQTRAAEDSYTLSAFSQMGSQKPGADTDVLEENTRSLGDRTRNPVKQYVGSRGRGPIVATVTPEKEGASAQIEVLPQGQYVALAKFRIKVADRLGAVEFLEIDSRGRMFVLAENIPPTRGDPASTFVARFSPMGVLDGVHELPLSQSVALSRRFVTVSPEGDVYFLRTRHASVDVVGVGFRPMRNAKVIDIHPGRMPDSFSQLRRGKGPLAAVRPLTRQQVVETAFAFESIKWRVTTNTYGRDPDTACTGFRRVRRPGYLHGKLGQEVRGIPYCWGCMGSLSQIGARFQRGVLAGNVCTKNEPRRDVAGVDCSAFVSAAWGLAQHYTTMAIPAISSPLSNAWDLKPGDALNKPGSHVMLFLRFTPDRKAEVMEASPGACNGRVCRNVYPLASLLARGYTPVRYRALTNEPAPTLVSEVQSEKQAGTTAKKRSEAGSRKKKKSRRSRGR